MKRNDNYIFLLVSGIIGMIVGILACITIIGLILGIPLIIGARKYLDWAKLSNEDLAKEKDNLLIWGIVFAILTFPIGLLALVPAFNTSGQIYSSEAKSYEPTHASSSSKKSKAERINELYDLKEKGLIDANDFEIAKNKIINENE